MKIEVGEASDLHFWTSGGGKVSEDSRRDCGSEACRRMAKTGLT